MSRLFRTTLIVLVSLGMLWSLANMAATALLVSSAIGIGLVFLALSLAVVLPLLRLTPMWPRAGLGWVLASLGWGAGTCILYAMVAADSVMTLSQATTGDIFAYSWGGAYPEELAKALGVAVICLSFAQLNRPWHAMMTGFIVGFGFELNENLLYGAMGALYDPNSDLSGALLTWGARLVAGPLLHACLTAVAGWGIGWALFAANRSISWRGAVAAGWLFIAFAVHFAWNATYVSQVGQIISYVVVALVIYPLTIAVFWRAWQAARHDVPAVVTTQVFTELWQLSPTDVGKAPAGSGSEVSRG